MARPARRTGFSCVPSLSARTARLEACHDGFVRTRTLVPYAAYLRVYEPLAAFSGAERDRLEAYVAASDRPDRHQVLAREQAAALNRALVTPPRAAPEVESADAYVIRDRGVVQVCPVQDRLRCWIALAEMREELPEAIAEAFLPAALSGQTELDFAVWQAEHPAVVPRILTSTWHIPARWFVPFGSAERTLALGHGVRSLVYRTRMVEARRRVARTARVLREAQVEGAVRTSIDDLGRWLEEFHPHGLVELDYGGLVYYLDDDELRADDSPGDVAAAVAAIADGDITRATEAYQRAIRRWEPVQARERAS